MSILTKHFTTIRPTINGNVFLQGLPLGIVPILIDTGATNTIMSYQFFRNHNIKPVRGGTTRSPYGRDVSTAIYENILIVLQGDNGNIHELRFPEISAIVDSVYDFPVILGMDVLSLTNFVMNGRDSEFTIIFNRI